MHESSITRQKILEEGKKEFLSKGFKNASLRSIARNADVTTGAFYFYFKDKEALFDALVNPAVEELKALFLELQIHFDELPREEKIKESFQYSQDRKRFIEFIFTHFDEFKLLVVHAQGTMFSNFIHDIAEIDVRYTIRFMEAVGCDALSSGRVSPELLHILSSAFFTGVFEIIVHDMTREAAEVYFAQLRRFYTIGWQDILSPYEVQ